MKLQEYSALRFSECVSPTLRVAKSVFLPLTSSREPHGTPSKIDAPSDSTSSVFQTYDRWKFGSKT